MEQLCNNSTTIEDLNQLLSTNAEDPKSTTVVNIVQNDQQNISYRKASSRK